MAKQTNDGVYATGRRKESTARVWLITAHSSCASRLTLQRSATFSAVRPMGMYTL